MAERPRSPHRRAERKERPYETESGEGGPDEAEAMPEMERGEGFESLRQDISHGRRSQRSAEPIEPEEREPQREPGTNEPRGIHETESLGTRRQHPPRSGEPMETHRHEQNRSGERMEPEGLREQSAKDRPHKRRRASERRGHEGEERRGRQQEREEE